MFLISGASGFVGQHLIRALHERQLSFVCLKQDENIGKNVQGTRVIIHLAGRAHVMRETAQEPLAAYMEVNHDYALRLANQAVVAGTKRFVYVSSIGVHGYKTDAGVSLNEQAAASPYNDYTFSKYRAELALQELAAKTGLEMVIVRSPLVYGPQVKANFLSLLKLVNRSWPLPLKSAHNLRSMVYVENLVDALIACATHPAATGEVFVVSDDETVSVAQLITHLANMMGRPEHVFYLPLSLLRLAAKAAGKGDVIDRLTQPLLLDGGKIRRTLDWRAPYTLHEGLQKTVDWFLSAPS